MNECMFIKLDSFQKAFLFFFFFSFQKMLFLLKNPAATWVPSRPSTWWARALKFVYWMMSVLALSMQFIRSFSSKRFVCVCVWVSECRSLILFLLLLFVRTLSSTASLHLCHSFLHCLFLFCLPTFQTHNSIFFFFFISFSFHSENHSPSLF